MTVGKLLEEEGGDLRTGPFGTALKAAEYTETGTPVVAVRDLADGYLKLTPDTPRVSRSTAERLAPFRLEQGDVLFGRKGAVDRCAFIRDSEAGWLMGSDCIRLRPPKTIEPRFLAFVVRAPRQRSWLLQHAIGSTMASLNQRIIKGMPVPVPPLPEQRRIAAILGTLDDKIELNRKMNRTLEEIAQTLFRAWFVDFEGETDLVESELGAIPRGWKVKSLDQIADFLNGVACQKYPSKNEETLPVIKIRELRQGFTDSSDRVSRYDLPDKYKIEPGDVLFSWSGSLVLKIWSHQPGALNQHIFKVTSSTYPRWFFYLWLAHHHARFRRIAEGKATTMGHIRRKHLSEALVVVPPSTLLEGYGQSLAPIQERMVTNAKENKTLAEIRDTLLPKLISGEIRVPEAEGLVEEAI